MQNVTDTAENLPIVVINISNNDVIGRVSIPLKFTTNYFTAKHLGDEFNCEFDGKCIHDGTRYDYAVSDFCLNKNLVNSDKLNDTFNRVKDIIKRISKKL